MHAAQRVSLAQRVSPWLTKGFWAVLDQGLFAGSNFLLNLLLAKWLTPGSYGSFTVLYSAFLLVAMFHTGLFTEPMMVYGASRYRARSEGYIRMLLQGTYALAVITGAIALGVGSWLLKDGALEVGWAVVALGVAQPVLLALWLMRRACYVTLDPQAAVAGGTVYLVVVAVGVGAAYSSGTLSPATAFVILALASLGGGWWIMRRQGVALRSQRRRVSRREVLRTHWAYGRWAVATSALTWIPSNIFFLVLPLWNGLESVGVLKALMNLLMPILHVNSALAVLLLPVLVRAKQDGRFKQAVGVAMLLLTAEALAYWGLIAAFDQQIIRWAYGGQYLSYGWALSVLGALPLLAGAAAIACAALRALELPQRVFWSYAGTAVVVLTLGLWAVKTQGILGACAGLLVSSAVTAGVAMAFLVPKTSSC